MGGNRIMFNLFFDGDVRMNEEELPEDVKDLIKFISEGAEEPNAKHGLMQAAVITASAFGRLQTFCKKCDSLVTFKQLDKDDGFSYSYLCKCGFTLYKFHKPDQFHKRAYYLKVFIPASKYDPQYKHKTELEKIGFKKTHQNGKTVFEK